MTFIPLIAFIVAIAACALAYGVFIEPKIVVVTRRTVPFPLTTSLTIALVGDFHVGPYKKSAFIRRVVDTVNAQKPDIVFLVGDFIFDPPADVDHLKPLAELAPALGTYAVLGNHDYHPYPDNVRHAYETPDQGEEIMASLSSLGIRVLRNEGLTIWWGGETFALVGTDDWGEDKILKNRTDLGAALAGVSDRLPVILLTHQPDIIREPLHEKASLIVCGHTHGGQVRLPWYGPVTRLPISISQSYDQGVFPLGEGRNLVITRGVGESGFPIRFWAWPEVMMLETEKRAA